MQVTAGQDVDNLTVPIGTPISPGEALAIGEAPGTIQPITPSLFGFNATGAPTLSDAAAMVGMGPADTEPLPPPIGAPSGGIATRAFEQVDTLPERTQSTLTVRDLDPAGESLDSGPKVRRPACLYFS
jgi:hypothetical protein